MGNILILYKSKYGSTERYAKMLQEELSERNRVTISTLKDFRGDITKFDTIVYGAGIKAYQMYDYKKFQKKVKKVDRLNTLIVVFAVGMMSANVSYAKRIISANKISDDVKFFYLRGAINLDKLKGFDASIVKHLVSNLMTRTDLTQDEKAFVSACLHSKDWVSRENIQKIAEYIKCAN